MQYYWYKPGNTDVANFCNLASEANQYYILKFGLLFCASSLPTNNDTSIQISDQETSTVICDPLSDVCRSSNYTINTLMGGIKNFTFVEGSPFELRINGSIQFTGVYFTFTITVAASISQIKFKNFFIKNLFYIRNRYKTNQTIYNTVFVKILYFAFFRH